MMKKPVTTKAPVARWVENPYYQHLTGETFFQHKLPIDPSSLTRWRGRIGEEGVDRKRCLGHTVTG